MKHMACGKDRLTIFVKINVRTKKITIATDNFLFFRIPYYELFITVFASVKLVKIKFLSSSATSFSEYYFTQAANLTQHIWCIVCINDVYLVMAFVRHSELAFWRQLTLQQLLCYWLDNFMFHFFLI